MMLSFGNTLKHKCYDIMPRDISHSGGALDNNYLKKYI